MTPKPRERLDRLVVGRKLAASRQRARALIMAAKVLVDGNPVDKPGAQVSTDAQIRLRSGDIAYVSRGGLKLEAALEKFSGHVSGAVCLDVGASTGGFTDCLLQYGAGYIYAVDVGYGQLAWKLRQDPRVKVIERTNVRHLTLEAVPQPIDVVVIDVAFISLRIVLPAVLKFLKSNAHIFALIKPQFEVGRGKVGKGGVVRDPRLHQQVLDQLEAFFLTLGLHPCWVIPSPIVGPKGNREFIALLRFSTDSI